MNYNIDDVSRIAGLIIERNPELAEEGLKGYEEAIKRLEKLTLHLICGPGVANSKALQAALLTSLNSGKRAFKGGVTVMFKQTIPLLLPWSKPSTLNQIIHELGGNIVNEDLPEPASFTLCFGEKARDSSELQVICNGWQGGVCTYKDSINLSNAPDFALGGVLAGSLAVGLAFLRVTGEKPDACSKSIGLSIWNPGSSWLSNEALGPEVTVFPQKFWFVGLGHLGQAFTWTLGMLPFSDPSKVVVNLQDCESVSKSNYDTGLLSEINNIGRKKTRVCSEWLESRGFSTNILERNFDEIANVFLGEPLVLIRGLDSAKARREMKIDKFIHTIDCGIGGTRSDFDSIVIHNFPEYPKAPSIIWDVPNERINNKVNEKAMASLGCGFYGKAISTSFVGAFASSLVLGELIRAGYGGVSTAKVSCKMRDVFNEIYVTSTKNYSHELAANGFI